ncbi:MAG: hypothetical protein J2P31_00015, partial [Blastocatellia bacterium]|nr:hypothetical protein [Blastocatellia bacterium]
MKVISITSLLLFALSVTPSISSHQATNSFLMSYAGQGVNDILTQACATTFEIKGQEPSAPGKYPVFVYTVGTGESINDNGAAEAAIAGMASRGFVAAAVQYDTKDFATCGVISGKAKCIYDSASQTSAITKLCSRSAADCSKGIVVGGFSQGSVIAILAKNFDSRVIAAWGIGACVQYATFNLSLCLAPDKRKLASDRLRVVNGEKDIFVGSPLPNATINLPITPPINLPDNGRIQARALTGFQCNTSNNCLQSNGSGWYLVLDTEITGGGAEHCYWRKSRNNINQCDGARDELNAQWQTDDKAPWA